MTKTLKCISPIDGSVFAERPVASRAEADAIVDRARAAQPAWAARPLKERIDLVARGVARLGEMNAEIVQELAHMMGRPVRYGGEFGGVNERSGYMAQVARKALAPIEIEDSDKFSRYIAREPQFTPPVIYSLDERDKLVFLIEARPLDPENLRPGLPVTVKLP